MVLHAENESNNAAKTSQFPSDTDFKTIETLPGTTIQG